MIAPLRPRSAAFSLYCRADATAVDAIANVIQRVVSSPHESRSVRIDLSAHYGLDAFQPADLRQRQEQQELWRLDTRCDELVDRNAG